MYRPRPLRPDRLRSLERPFSWIPFRLLSSGLLGELSRPAKLLYFFLCLVADRQGMSYYGERRVHALLGLSAQELELARAELLDLDLLAFDGRIYQLLSLPASPPVQPAASTSGSRRAPEQDSPEQGAQQLSAILQRLSRRGR